MKYPFNDKNILEQASFSGHLYPGNKQETEIPVVLLMTSYPPRECGIATYSQDLILALNKQFDHSFEIQVCAFETGLMDYEYPEEVSDVLQTDIPVEYALLAQRINENERICLVLLQHEFGFFQLTDDTFQKFIQALEKPLITVFHTVLPQPDTFRITTIQQIVGASESVIVMTNHAADVLKNEYAISAGKIEVIPHGTHLVPHLDKVLLKEKYQLTGRKVLATFGLLSSGKGIETTLEALPKIIKKHPEVVFLILGKTHPAVVRSEGEVYRDLLQSKVTDLKLEDHVIFINKYLSLNDLLEYLQLTDIYLFTSKDPHQTVSGTFSYALSCGCPIISTPIPHAKEVLNKDTGILIDFQNPAQLGKAVENLLGDEALRNAFSSNSLERIASTSWENSAIAHAALFQRSAKKTIELNYCLPPVNLAHFHKLTTEFGMIQFSRINQPDLNSGYTLDDNSRALIAMCMHYELTQDETSLHAIQTYLNFISFCQQTTGKFSNYVDIDQQFTTQNRETNISDSNGRAIWALGYLISKDDILPQEMRAQASSVLYKTLKRIKQMHSPRTMAFTIKGLYLSNRKNPSSEVSFCIKLLADRLIQIFRHESEPNWPWFESYLTYANSILPEALLYAWQETGDQFYKEVAKSSFDFLLSLTFTKTQMKVISNKSWLHKGKQPEKFGEQPIDVAYTILALNHFYEAFEDESYFEKSQIAFSWFLGNNHLSQIIYNPCTGGCYDGLEQKHVNLNQGAESTISYLIARLSIEKQKKIIRNPVKKNSLLFRETHLKTPLNL